MLVYIIADTNKEGQLLFRVASENRGLSHVYVLPGQAHFINGNPYSVYGKYAAEYLGVDDKFTLNIRVAHVCSGAMTTSN